MFGYVIADLARLDTAQQARYKSVYCGLCRTLYRGYGPVPALALTYDMAFLTLLLSALYEPDEKAGAARCLRHPARAQSWTQTEFTGYAAAMNCLLAYENRLDDWHDDRRLSAAAAAGLHLDDGLDCQPAELAILPNTGGREAHITIREGKFHQIKRMMAYLGKPVLYLERVRMGNLTLDSALPRGSWRFLTEDEVCGLEIAVGEAEKNRNFNKK